MTENRARDGWGPFRPDDDLIGSRDRPRSEQEINEILEAATARLYQPDDDDAAPEEPT